MLRFILILILIYSCGKKDNTSNQKNLSTNEKPDKPLEREEVNPKPKPATAEEISYHQSGTFLAKFETLNTKINGNVPGSSTIFFQEERIYTYVRLFAGFPKVWHQQKVYNGNECPKLKDDINMDGFLDINEVEKIVGKVLLPLDANISSQNAGKNFYPIADESGSYSYERITRFQNLEKDLKSKDLNPEDNVMKLDPEDFLKIENKVIIIYGISSEVPLPETVSGQGKYEAFQTFPVACGKYQKVQNFPGKPYSEEIPGPIEEIEN